MTIFFLPRFSAALIVRSTWGLLPLKGVQPDELTHSLCCFRLQLSLGWSPRLNCSYSYGDGMGYQVCRCCGGAIRGKREEQNPHICGRCEQLLGEASEVTNRTEGATENPKNYRKFYRDPLSRT